MLFSLCQVRLEKISATLFEVTVNRKKSFLNRRKNCAIYIRQHCELLL
ncbi:hypothetical protein RUMCAL_02996 [Ruminococcus callidus ATCC 27760]|uniref:Uncharacterized protein n=1 Tax=Ruminococcus callidus ATCC 27760 TaxID=411473 RepID=U2KAD1_9FIRM|nr:hypothetical protein RUMCAL_02996 [Ruminococcus callidus ATCC 27760]